MRVLSFNPKRRQSTMRYPIAKDHRYTITKEWCGYEEQRHVVRFCGDWVGQSKFYASAVTMAVGHNATRMGALTITEQKPNE